MIQPQFDVAPFLEKLDLGMIDIRTLIIDRARQEHRVAVLLQRGLLIFGDENRFASWLARPHSILGHRTPLSILAAGELEQLEDELTRIEYGDLNA